MGILVEQAIVVARLNQRYCDLENVIPHQIPRTNSTVVWKVEMQETTAISIGVMVGKILSH